MNSLRKTETEPGPDGIDPGDLLISSHERLLGVDLTVHPRWLYREMWGLQNRSGFTKGVEVRAVGSDKRPDRLDRRYLAAWARRNLFRPEVDDGE